MTHSYLFYYGALQQLSQAEIIALLPQIKINPISPHIFQIDSAQELDLNDLICRFGSVIKIASKVDTFTQDPVDHLVQALIKADTKNFSLTLLNSDSDQDLSQTVKNKLTQLGHRSRFVTAQKSFLSPLVIKKQHLTELIIDFQSKTIYQTQVIHDFNSWITRDRHKPYSDARSGMLPPKLARTMINLALRDSHPTGKTLLDPFCGTGTVLLEARLLGLNVIGSDLSQTAVKGALANLDWLNTQKSCTPTGQFQVHHADSAHLDFLSPNSVDYIVTEPFLGPPNPSPAKFKNISKGLQKLYLGSLKHWHQFLKKGGRIVMVFPIFNFKNNHLSTSSFIDTRENLGYNLLEKNLIFTRPGATITRQIIILEKN